MQSCKRAAALLVGVAFNEHEEIIGQFEEAHIVHKKILVALARGVNVRVIIEIITFPEQFVPVQRYLAFGIQFGQDTPVFTQRMVDVAHQVAAVAVVFIIEAVSALVRTETFVNAACNGFPAFCASPFHRFFQKHIFKNTRI
jgi:hypothetical protein